MRTMVWFKICSAVCMRGSVCFFIAILILYRREELPGYLEVGSPYWYPKNTTMPPIMSFVYMPVIWNSATVNALGVMTYARNRDILGKTDLHYIWYLNLLLSNITTNRRVFYLPLLFLRRLQSAWPLQRILP